MVHPAFPRSEKYDAEWVRKNSLGENALHLVESLSQIVQFKPGDRVLDLGCGKGITSIFLAREFGAKVWAVDDTSPTSETERLIVAWDCAGCVIPVHASALALPPLGTQFDAIVAIQSYMYYGADPNYLSYILQFLKPGGVIAIVDACFTREVSAEEAAIQLGNEARPRVWAKMHTLDWWKSLWSKESLVMIEHAEHLPQADFILDEYIEDHLQDRNERELVHAVLRDETRLLSLFRMSARKV